MDEDELFGQHNFNLSYSETPYPYTHQTDLYPALRAILLKSISEAKITAKNILMLTKSPSITESYIIDKALELLSIIIGKTPASTSHNRTLPDKQILETLAKLTKKVDKLSEQVNEPRQRSSRITEPKEGLEASRHVPQTLTKSYVQTISSLSKTPTSTTRSPVTHNPKISNPNKAHDPTRLVVCFPPGTNTTLREDNLTIVNDINQLLKSNGVPDNQVVIAVKWNLQGNCIVITCSDTTTADIIPFTEGIANVIIPGATGTIREDKKWFKIEVNNVRTGA